MTGILLAAVLLLTVLSLLELFLLFGVIRRLREHEAKLAASNGAGGPGAITVPVGTQIEDFATEAVDGTPVSGAALDGPTLVGFFSPQCRACHERLPDFQSAVAAHAGPVLAVVVRDGGDTDALVARLTDRATVVVEDAKGTMCTAFGVRGYPAFARLSADRVLLAQGFTPPVPA